MDKPIEITISKLEVSLSVKVLFSKFYDLFPPATDSTKHKLLETTENIHARMLDLFPSENYSIDDVFNFLHIADYNIVNISDKNIDMRWLLKQASNE